MFNLAEMWGLRPDGSNPRKHIKKYPEEKRERFLSPAELRRVGEVLREMEQEGIELPSSIAAIRLLMLTGCRLGEIMTLKWEYVDIPGKALRLPDSKTGAKVVHLGQPAVEVLREDRTRRGKSVGDRGNETRRAAHGSPAVLATCPSARRAQGRPHPRSAAHVCVDRRRRRSGTADDRQAARAYAGADDRTVCASCGGSG